MPNVFYANSVLILVYNTYNRDKEFFLECERLEAEASKRAALAIARFRSSTFASEFFLELGWETGERDGMTKG